MQAGHTDFFYSSSDGLRLHARIYASPCSDALPAVCLPGLTRNARDFHELALALRAHPRTPRPVIVFDYRGRGLSAYDSDWKNYNVAVEARDVAAGLSALRIDRAAFIGTSRGGLIMHVLAATHPQLLRAGVLNDIGPVVEADGLAHIRAYLQNPRTPRDFEEAVAIQRAIHGASFPALSDDDWRRMAAAVYRDDNVRPVADFDPALVDTLAGLDLSQPLPAIWEAFGALARIPLLVVRGEHSKLLSEATVAEMARRHPALESATVAGQGHPPMLETGDLPERIAAFLAGADRG